MSRMVPQPVVDVFRSQANVSIDLYGIECDVYIPTNVAAVQYKDIYSTPEDYTFNHFTTRIWIEWSPSNRRLRRFGIFAEDDLPILARFQTKMVADNKTIVTVDPIIHTYFKIATQFIPTKYEKIDEFEVVDILTSNRHNALISQVYKCAPRRTP